MHAAELLELGGALLGAFVSQSLAYFFVVGAVFWVVWRRGARWLRPRRIEVRHARQVDRAQLRREALHSAVVLAAGAAQALTVMRLADRGAVRLLDGPGPWGWPGALLMIGGLILFNDLWFYGVHRLLHTRWLFRHVHSVHHRSVDVNPFTSYSFHVVEALLISAWVIPAALTLPVPLAVLGAVQVIGLGNNINAHLGYELLPAWWVRAPGLRWSNSATFHSMHHTGFKGNYGLFTRLWDRWLGTELPGYEAAFAAAHPPATPPAGPVTPRPATAPP